MPETSVIIPFHDRFEWTCQAIATVIGQSYQDFEIIVVDDGSAEDYRPSIEKLDARISYIRQEQRGAGAARNAGIKVAVGEFIAFLDSDDLFLPEKLEIQIGILRDHPEVLLTHSSYILVDETGNEIALVPSGTFTGYVYPRIYFGCRIVTSTVIVKKKVFEHLEFEERARIGQDIILWMKISKLGKIIGVERPLAKFRVHGNNSMLIPDKQIDGLKNIFNFGIRADKDVKFILRQQIESRLYFLLAFWYVQKKDYSSAARNVIISFLKWPFRKELYIKSILYFLPKKIKQRILKEEPD
jgi:glycosyltransferase involved in cell wall biosynthesis